MMFCNFFFIVQYLYIYNLQKLEQYINNIYNAYKLLKHRMGTHPDRHRKPQVLSIKVSHH